MIATLTDKLTSLLATINMMPPSVYLKTRLFFLDLNLNFNDFFDKLNNPLHPIVF